MSEKVIIVNTHPAQNPIFVGKLQVFMNSIGIEPEIADGYDSMNPLSNNPSHIILTGVPISANYSLSEPETQRQVNGAFGWLRDCEQPVLGICYGHQIMAQIFGGAVSSLREMVNDKSLKLNWEPEQESGIFSGVESLEVFAEHRDYVEEIPEGFKILCQINQIPYIMYHPKREMYGLQFVPEQSDQKTKNILKRFVWKQ